MIKKLTRLILKYRITSGFIILALVVGSYFIFRGGDSGEARYVLASVKRGAITTSISGTGQVSASDQIEVKAKVSGDVIYIGARNGQFVGSGAVLVQLDPSMAQKAVRDAELNLESAKLALEKLKKSRVEGEKIKEDAFNTVSSAFLDLPIVVSGAETIISGSTINSQQSNSGYYQNFVDSYGYDQMADLIRRAANDYNSARFEYNRTFLAYQNTSRNADSQTIADLLNKTIDASKTISQAIKSEQNVLDYLIDYTESKNKILPSLVTTYRLNLQTYTNQVNGHLLNMINIQNTVKNAPLDIASQELAVKQRENALLDAQENLDDYSVRAPFAGVAAKINALRGESISSGTVVTNFITSQHIAEISLNEIDVAQIKAGQSADLTFDAVPDLKIPGQVTEIDTVGTISQGVVSYAVKVIFGSADIRIKPAMTASADIIIQTKGNVLVVPSSAVKSQGNIRYIEIAEGETGNNRGVSLFEPPRRQNIQTGISNDDLTEVISGLAEGDVVVARVIQPNATTQSTPAAQNPFFRAPGGGQR